MEIVNEAPSPPSPPLIQDLKVTLQRSYTIFPIEKIEREFMFLSNIDQLLDFNLETVHFFLANPNFPPEKVSEILEISLGKLLVPYNFLAGRLRFDEEKGRLEIDCNSSGIGFAVASSEVSLAEIGDLVYPNPVFGQLILRNFKCMEPDDRPLCTVQVTSFKCGSFAMGLSINHVVFDGVGIKIFLENLASLAVDQPLAITICNNRKLLAARSPPRVTFPHPEMLRLEIPPQLGAEPNTPILMSDPTGEKFEYRVFRLSANEILGLKEKAKLGLKENDIRMITGFNVVTAHVWRCRALAEANGKKLEKASTTTILYATDLRKRLSPALPSSFTGNAVLPAYGIATYGDLERASFSELVEMVSAGASRMTDEYARSAIDLMETCRGPPNGDIIVTSWWRLGFSDVEYPWGRPRYACPIPSLTMKHFIAFLPDIDDKGGVNVLLTLPTDQLETFQNLFCEFLA